eukprot:COSAG06_NODE_1603_length_8956_cov_6.771029_6_plen_168_part_00
MPVSPPVGTYRDRLLEACAEACAEALADSSPSPHGVHSAHSSPSTALQAPSLHTISALDGVIFITSTLRMWMRITGGVPEALRRKKAGTWTRSRSVAVGRAAGASELEQRTVDRYSFSFSAGLSAGLSPSRRSSYNCRSSFAQNQLYSLLLEHDHDHRLLLPCKQVK